MHDVDLPMTDSSLETATAHNCELCIRVLKSRSRVKTRWQLAIFVANLKLQPTCPKADDQTGHGSQKAGELNSFQLQGVQRGRIEQQVTPRTVEQRQAGRSEGAVQTEGNLGQQTVSHHHLVGLQAVRHNRNPRTGKKMAFLG